MVYGYSLESYLAAAVKNAFSAAAFLELAPVH
jgi:hypothetical protein